jgi:hypothetical protein
MSDLSTRSTHIRHQRLVRLAPALVAVLFFSTADTQATSQKPNSFSPAPHELNLPASGEMAITTVASGQEGLELSAIYTPDGVALVENVNWKISDQDQALIYDKTTSVVALYLAPGEYHVEAVFGSMHHEEVVSVRPGTRIGMSFVMNAGALRVLPRVKGIDQFGLSSTSKIFALSGVEKGKLVAICHRPGEVLNVAAGAYRIESKFSAGNAVAVADVTVKAGYTSAVNIDHIAGVAKLNVAGNDAREVEWQIVDDKGTALPSQTGITVELILKPGHYFAAAKLGEQNLKTEFQIDAGQASEINLNP